MLRISGISPRIKNNQDKITESNNTEMSKQKIPFKKQSVTTVPCKDLKKPNILIIALYSGRSQHLNLR